MPWQAACVAVAVHLADHVGARRARRREGRHTARWPGRARRCAPLGAGRLAWGALALSHRVLGRHALRHRAAGAALEKAARRSCGGAGPVPGRLAGVAVARRCRPVAQSRPAACRQSAGAAVPGSAPRARPAKPALRPAWGAASSRRTRCHERARDRAWRGGRVGRRASSVSAWPWCRLGCGINWNMLPQRSAGLTRGDGAVHAATSAARAPRGCRWWWWRCRRGPAASVLRANRHRG